MRRKKTARKQKRTRGCRSRHSRAAATTIDDKKRGTQTNLPRRYFRIGISNHAYAGKTTGDVAARLQKVIYEQTAKMRRNSARVLTKGDCERDWPGEWVDDAEGLREVVPMLAMEDLRAQNG